MFDKAPYGRDKVCGDGLTPRAVGALNELKIDMSDAHQIAGLRMIANKTVRELAWPATSRFPAHGAVWPRRRLDKALADAADAAGADIVWETEAIPRFDGDRVVGVDAGGERWSAKMVVAATGAPGAVARMLGAMKVEGEPYGIAIRSYVESPRHDFETSGGDAHDARRQRELGTRITAGCSLSATARSISASVPSRR